MSINLFLVSILLMVSGWKGEQRRIRKLTMGEPTTLRIGEKVRFDGTSLLTVEMVENDSRCPDRVRCRGDGNAEVVLGYRSGKRKGIHFRLNTSPQLARDTVIDGYQISLHGLLPKRRTDHTPTQKEYRVSLLVEKAIPE